MLDLNLSTQSTLSSLRSLAPQSPQSSPSPPLISNVSIPLLHSPMPSPSRSIKRDHEAMLDKPDLLLPINTSTESTIDNLTIGGMTDACAQIVIDILGTMLTNVKMDVWYKLLHQQQKSVNDIPSVPLLAVNTFLYQVQDNIKTPTDFIAADIYCLMTGFMAIYLGLIELVFHDLIKNTTTKHYQENPFDDYMGLFACGDDVASSADDLFTWYHWQYRDHIVIDLRQRLISNGFQQFKTLDLIDTVLTQFYTTHLLQPVAIQHQKDHGQFYTPQSVVRFMWSLCLNNHNFYTKKQQDSIFDTDFLPSTPFLPRVFDPCMGIGAFLCEYLTRMIEATKRHDNLWNNGDSLKYILAQLPETIWGVEIDPFAYKLGKLNIMVHMFPFYQQGLSLGTSFQNFSIGRLSLFRNDTLRLDLDANPYTTKDKAWERRQLLRLRDPSQLVFDYVVTNPPYMIRKTGFVNDPDKALYDDRYLAGKGTQAYMYFMWLCLQRCDPLCGQLCFITPSQWTVLEFAENLRKWIWTHCQLLDFFQFEPYKVWPKVQTDSLIFRLCKRQQQSHMIGNMNGKIISKNHHQSGQVMFLRHLSRKSTLTEILYDYQHFDRHHLESQNPLIKYKFTMTDDIELLMTTMHGSFAYLSPTSAVSDQLMALTRDYPRICDGERGVKGSQTPLVWHRGPNTNPVYALVVRTQWALDTFGKACCDEWLRPVFYWNGKSSTPSSRSSSSTASSNRSDSVNPSIDSIVDPNPISSTLSTSSTPSALSPSSSSSSSLSSSPLATSCKEVQFWSPRDPLRLTKKENSPAEAYVPFDGRDNNNIDDSFYSMILVDKEGASRLDKSSALYQYLHEARLALQPGQMDKELAWCHFNKCGMNIGVKLVHPINFGYFSRTQPRQRFFMDQQQRCVTNQCMYFTVKHQEDSEHTDDTGLSSSSSSLLLSPSCSPHSTSTPTPLEHYYLGILNSSIVQFFIRAHCYYDQQGRTRFFGKHMAKIPHAPPTSSQVDTMNIYVQQLIAARTLIYAMIRYVDDFGMTTMDSHEMNSYLDEPTQRFGTKQQLRSVMEKVRNCIWDLAPADRQLLEQVSPFYFESTTKPRTMSPVESSMESKLKGGGGNLADQLIRLLIVQSLLQYAVDHLAYKVYGIPSDLQLQLEQELRLSLTLQWQAYQHHFQGRSIMDMVNDILIGTLVIE